MSDQDNQYAGNPHARGLCGGWCPWCQDSRSTGESTDRDNRAEAGIAGTSGLGSFRGFISEGERGRVVAGEISTIRSYFDLCDSCAVATGASSDSLSDYWIDPVSGVLQSRIVIRPQRHPEFCRRRLEVESIRELGRLIEGVVLARLCGGLHLRSRSEGHDESGQWRVVLEVEALAPPAGGIACFPMRRDIRHVSSRFGLGDSLEYLTAQDDLASMGSMGSPKSA